MVMSSGRRSPGTANVPSTPTGFAVGAGAVGLVAAAIIAAAIPSADAGWRFAVMAVAVGVFAAISIDQLALAGIVVLAFLISNGFLEDRLGQLAWHGSADLWRLLLLVIVGAIGLALGEAVRFMANIRVRWAAEFERTSAASSPEPWPDARRPRYAEPPANESSRWSPESPSDDQLARWANNVASAAELNGRIGPRPVDLRAANGGNQRPANHGRAIQRPSRQRPADK